MGFNRYRPRVISTVVRRTRTLVRCTCGTTTRRPCRDFVPQLYRLIPVDNRLTKVLAGYNTRTARGTVGVTYVGANHANIVTFSNNFRKHALTTIGLGNGITPCGHKLNALTDNICRVPFPDPSGSVDSRRTVSTLRHLFVMRASVSGVNTVVIRPMRKRNNFRLLSPAFTRCLHGFYSRRNVLLVVSRVRSNCNHANAPFTFARLKVRPSLVLLNGDVTNNLPLNTIVNGTDIIGNLPGNDLNNACSNGPITYTTTGTALSVVRTGSI